MIEQELLKNLPYEWPFLFVDEITDVNEEEIQGKFTFDSNLPFFQGHFKNKPVTPGAILTECCAQIGVVCLGLYLLGDNFDADAIVALTNSEMEFLLPVLPEETVMVKSEKVYFRFNKLKCKVKMFNAEGKLVCRGIIAGILKPSYHA